jgi:predicted RNA-binding Zn-ribbon protein involved in translation (DUF1610 family)
MTEINWDEVKIGRCVSGSEVHPEHDYDEYECLRCGEPAPMEDEECE